MELTLLLRLQALLIDASHDQLKKAKHFVQYEGFAAYHLSLDTYFLEN